jgi:hypothetical protein
VQILYFLLSHLQAAVSAQVFHEALLRAVQVAVAVVIQLHQHLVLLTKVLQAVLFMAAIRLTAVAVAVVTAQERQEILLMAAQAVQV